MKVKCTTYIPDLKGWGYIYPRTGGNVYPHPKAARIGYCRQNQAVAGYVRSVDHYVVTECCYLTSYYRRCYLILPTDCGHGPKRSSAILPTNSGLATQ